MKCRIDFVTNSSSSSFLIITNDENPIDSVTFENIDEVFKDFREYDIENDIDEYDESTINSIGVNKEIFKQFQTEIKRFQEQTEKFYNNLGTDFLRKFIWNKPPNEDMWTDEERKIFQEYQYNKEVRKSIRNKFLTESDQVQLELSKEMRKVYLMAIESLAEGNRLCMPSIQWDCCVSDWKKRKLVHEAEVVLWNSGM